MVGYLNLSRLLLRWMEQIHLPRSAIRMRYVHLVHAYHVLDRKVAPTMPSLRVHSGQEGILVAGGPSRHTHPRTNSDFYLNRYAAAN